MVLSPAERPTAPCSLPHEGRRISLRST